MDEQEFIETYGEYGVQLIAEYRAKWLELKAIEAQIRAQLDLTLEPLKDEEYENAFEFQDDSGRSIVTL